MFNGRTSLSYSSARVLSACERKFYHYKVEGTSPDPDNVSSDLALRVGSAYHGVLEDTMHERDRFTRLILEKRCEEFDLDEDSQCMIWAMAAKYYSLHQKSELKVVECELAIEHEKFLGFVDAIMVDPDGGWYICDLKTASSVNKEHLKARLSRDLQLNLYAYFQDYLKGLLLGGAFGEFQGCLYRTVTKSRLSRREGEEATDFVKRMMGGIKAYSFHIPVSALNPKTAWEEYSAYYQRAIEIAHGDEAKCNTDACLNYYRPCEYWSQCHGQLYSKSSGVKVSQV